MKHYLSLFAIVLLLVGCAKKSNTTPPVANTANPVTTTIANNETEIGSEGLLAFNGTVTGNYKNYVENNYVEKDTSYTGSMTLSFPDTGKVRITGNIITASQDNYTVTFHTEMVNLVFDKRADGVYSYSPQRHTYYTLKVMNATTMQFAKQSTAVCSEISEHIEFNGTVVK